MNCPCCSNLLTKSRSGDTDPCYCSNCNGMWFEDGSFTPYVKALSLDESIVGQETTYFEIRQVDSLRELQEPIKICPACSFAMKKFNYAYDSNVILDKCTNCSGIWTDADEVELIASYLKKDERADALGTSLAKNMNEKDQVRQEREAIRDILQGGAFLYLPKIIIPLGDDTPRQRFSIVTVLLIVSCVIVFALEAIAPDVQEIFKTFGSTPTNLFHYGLITSMFLHGDIVHLVGNMLFLWMFGDNVEDRFGRFKFIFFYILAGIVAGLLHAVCNPDSTTPCIGASGAISGVMGAYIILFPYARVKVFCVYRIVHLPAWTYLGGWFAFQLLYASISSLIASNVAWFAHIGGFAFGMAAAVCIKLMYKKQA